MWGSLLPSVGWLTAEVPLVSYTISEDEALGRVDVVLAQLAGFTRSHAQMLIEQGLVSLNGARVQRAKQKVAYGDTLAAEEQPPLDVPTATEIPLTILYEDDDVIVVDKPAGLVVHPAPGHYGDTLVNALLARQTSLSTVDPLRPGILHRLDKDTSGLMVVAKNNAAHVALAEQFVPRFDEEGRSLKRAQRHYTALVFGRPTPPAGKIQTFIARHPHDRQKMAVVRPPSTRGKWAVTNYKVIKTWEPPISTSAPLSLVDFHLETGRTHQIRVHSQFMGWPLVGDPLYGVNPHRTKGWPENIRTYPHQALHASQLSFFHPRTGEKMEFTRNAVHFWSTDQVGDS